MAVKTKGLVPRLWRRTKRVLIVLFLLHFIYILVLRWVDPPITLTQMGSLLRGDGLKRDYINIEDISPYAKLAFMAAEDQKFPEFTVAGVPHGLFFAHKWWVACDDKIDTEMLRKKIDEHLIKLNDDYAVERKKVP